jgi:hypothetical protein
MDVVVGKTSFKDRVHAVIGLNSPAGGTEGGDYNGYGHLQCSYGIVSRIQIKAFFMITLKSLRRVFLLSMLFTNRTFPFLKCQISGCLQCLFPITVAGLPRFFTGFSFKLF